MTLASAADHPNEPVYDAAFLRRVIDATSDGIAVHRAVRDGSGQIVDFEMVFVNEVLLGMFPPGSGNWVGRRLREHLPATLDDGRYQLLEEAVESGTPQATEVEATFLRGTRHRLALSAIPRGDQVVVSLRDVTREHEALTALAESEGRYRDLVEHQAELVCRFLPDSTLLFANEAFAHYYGHEPDELVGKRMLDLLPEPRREPAAVTIASLTPEHPLVIDEGFLYDTDGNERWQQWSTSAVVEDGRVTQIQAVGIDITDRKRAEVAVEERSEVLALVTQVSQRFIEIPPDEVDSGIEAALTSLGQAMGADRAYVTQYRPDGVLLDMTHEWTAPGVPAARPFVTAFPDSTMPRVRETLSCSETVRIASVGALGPGWEADRAAWEATGVESTMVMPLVDGGRLIGSVGFDVCGRARSWSDQEATVLGSAAVSFGQVIARRDAEIEVRRSERRFRALVEGIPDLLIRVDSEGVVLDWRPSAEDPTFLSPDAASGRLLTEVFPELVWPVERALQHGEAGTSRVEAVEESRGGHVRSYEARVTVAGNEAIVVVRDVTEQQRLQTSLIHQATHDALTGLANRRLFSEHLDDALRHGRRSGAFPAVLFIDLDQFKVLNDSQGHDVGDAVLRAAADRLTRSVRPGDVVARLGGDEFAVLSHRIPSAADALSLAERVVAATSEPVQVEGEDVVITSSIGVVVAVADSTVASVLRDADAAMYHAKAMGRRRVELFTEEIREAALARHQVEHDLRRAFDTDELELYYQPLWSLVEGGWVGVEALIRWNHPVRGLLAPDQFLPVAEDAGLMSRLGAWVLDRACRDARRWLVHRHAGVRVWVNLAADQLMSPTLVGDVMAALDAYQLPSDAMGVEVTETAVVGDIAQARATLAELRRRGVKVALDDFGTGLSSLTHLDALPLDVVKLDGAFVGGAASEGRQRDLVDGIVTLVKRLGLEVLAERVEAQADLDALSALGVDSLQGYFLGRPMRVSELPSFLSSVTAASSA
ncbi:MAG: EAL domain-containing protein [Acidimicrobiales bacterium]